MKKYILLVLFLTGLMTVASGQKYYSKTGHVQFISDAPIEKITANNNNSYVIFDNATGKFEFSALIKGFAFQKALMQEHFNENYMESDEYPKAIYKGSITNWSSLHLMEDHVYQVNIDGQLTMHGVTKPFKSKVELSLKNGNILASSSFDIAIEDFNIQIPKVVRDNISKNVRVNVKVELLPMNK